MRKYTAYASVGRREIFSAEHATREAAAADLFVAHPVLRRCATGYGYHGSFDMQFHDRPALESPT